MWRSKVFSESDNALIYVDVHDAVLAAVERDAALRQEVCCLGACVCVCVHVCVSKYVSK